MAKDNKNGAPKKPRRSRQMIEENLKRVYEETAKQDIPEQLKDLLARLKKADEEGGRRK